MGRCGNVIFSDTWFGTFAEMLNAMLRVTHNVDERRAWYLGLFSVRWSAVPSAQVQWARRLSLPAARRFQAES